MRATLSLLISTTLVAAFAAGHLLHRFENPDLTSFASFRAALEEGDPLVRAHHFGAFLSELGPDELPEVLDLLETRRYWPGDDEMRDFMLAWTGFDARRALDWALARPGHWRRKASGAAIYAWAFHDPQGALEAFEALDESAPRNLLEERLVLGWLQSGRREGIAEFIAGKAPSLARQKYVNALTTELMRDGPEAVIAWVEAIPDDPEGAIAGYKKVAFEKAANVLAVVDPLAASRWAEDHLGHPYGATGPDAVARRWVEQDPDAAMDWLMTLPRTRLRDNALKTTFGVWLSDDRSGAETWLRRTSPDPSTDALVRILVSRDRTFDPATALSWALRLHDPILHRKVLIGAARDWYRRHPADASSWLADNDVPEEFQTIIKQPPKPRDDGEASEEEGEGGGEEEGETRNADAPQTGVHS